MNNFDVLSDPLTTAVVTVSFGSAEVLDPFLDSVAVATRNPVGVVVVDNRPDDEVRALADSRGAAYLPLKENVGYGGAVNAAVDQLPSSVDWVLISNPDVLLHRGALDALVAQAMSDPRVGAVGPTIYTPDGSVYPSARAIPSISTGVGHALFAERWTSNPWTRAYRNEGVVGKREAGWLSGACVLVRRSAFDGVGGFDAGYFMYFEDVDLGYRLGRAGYLNVYEPAASVTHVGAHSTRSEPAGMARAHHASARRFLSRRYSGILFWPMRTFLNLSLVARSFLASRRPPAG